MGLTKEQKKARKEAKRLEKLRLEIEQNKQMKRDALQREITAQKKTRAELDRSWREMMLKIKEPIFHKEMMVMWHTFERAYDKKEYLIKYSLNLIEKADDQFQRTISGFCDIFDAMINKFLQDLDDMAKDNDNRVRNLRIWGESILSKINADNNAAESHLQLMIYDAHTSNDQQIWNTRGDNVVKEDEERMKNLNEREDLRSHLEDKFNAMWNAYKATLKAYVTNTAENQKQLRRLRHKETIMQDIIASQGKKIANSESLHRRLRNELLAYESGEKQAVFRDRYRRHRNAYARLKIDLRDGCNIDMDQMDTLVKVSNESLEWLEEAFKKGEKIMKVAAMCRKFETRKEKVLPFGFETPHEPFLDTNVSKKGKQRVPQTDSNTSMINEAMAGTGGLARLWHKISKAELSKRALIREKEMLENENRVLMMHIESNNNSDRTVLPSLSGTDCICGNKRKAGIHRPFAIDGGQELSKYKKQW